MRGRSGDQYPLFDFGQSLPNGFSYHPNFITPAEESALIAAFEALPLTPAPYKEYTAKRRILSFGWGYNEESAQLVPGEPLPDFMRPIATRAATLAGIPKNKVVEALITEYRPGTGVGWHCDNESFEKVIGISFAGWCQFDMRPLHSSGEIESFSVTLEPRSAYIMQGVSRWSYQHRVLPTKALRYSITFRTLPA